MASNIKYPDKELMYFIEGNNLALISSVDSTGDRNTTDRKNWKAIQESVSNGLLIKYQAEPNPVSAITDTPDIDNTCHAGIVDYVKSKLYMDRAGSTSDGNLSAVSASLSSSHEARWNDMVRRMGMKKRDKTGGTRSIVPYDMM